MVTGVRADWAVDPTQPLIPPALREVTTRARAGPERHASAAEMEAALASALSGCALQPIAPAVSRKKTKRSP